jgi:hypothetical protein
MYVVSRLTSDCSIAKGKITYFIQQLTPTAPYLPGFHPTTPLAGFPYQYIFEIDLSTPFDHQTLEIQASLSCPWNRYLPNLGQVELSRIDHDQILSQYFNSGTGWLSGLVPVRFLCGLVSSLGHRTAHPTIQSTHYTSLLHCSLLAFASSLSENPLIRARDTRDKFVTQAKEWLFDQFSDFHPTLLPTLTLLALYHHSVGEENTSYMYLGKDPLFLWAAN